ncbi:hypothetical protein [Paracerasibacillus soli]|uniref:Uncharacterized protein n=1 Tax=Paracerasibacillus soli TaxID=480284 RepID=A0ABU5CT94_9BACI|nr:hypothetical protein [Virgibacillus soli]MDY0409588.1 hypothetical protein [Virgibacillus soli]
MKKIIISIACIIIVGLSVATIYYQKLPPLTLADAYPILRGHPDHDTTQNQTQNEPKKIQPIYEQDNIGYAFQEIMSFTLLLTTVRNGALFLLR